MFMFLNLFFTKIFLLAFAYFPFFKTECSSSICKYQADGKIIYIGDSTDNALFITKAAELLSSKLPDDIILDMVLMKESLLPTDLDYDGTGHENAIISPEQVDQNPISSRIHPALFFIGAFIVFIVVQAGIYFGYEKIKSIDHNKKMKDEEEKQREQILIARRKRERNTNIIMVEMDEEIG